MAGETPLTIVGNLVGDPELRFTPSGAAVANFVVASTPRKFNRQTNEFEDGEPLFQRCAVWREQAENATETLSKGMRVVVTGNLEGSSWEDKETGAKRTGTQMNVLEVAPSLRYATAQVTKVQRGQQQGGQQQGYGQQGPPPQQQGWGNQQQQAPGWAGQGQQPPQQGNTGPLNPPQQGGWGDPPQQAPGGWGQPPQQQPPAQQGWGNQPQQQAPTYDEPPFDRGF